MSARNPAICPNPQSKNDDRHVATIEEEPI